MPSLSNILNTDLALEAGTTFNALTDTEKMARLNSVYQEIADLINLAGKTDLKKSTHTGASVSPLSASNIRSGSGVCNIAGTRINFDTGPITGSFTVVAWTDTGFNVIVSGADASGFTASTVTDGETVYYHAIPNA